MKLKKADEMEMLINFKAMRLSWIFGNIALLIWLTMTFIKNDELPYILFAIISLQNVIYFGSKLYMTGKMSSDEK